MAPWTASPTGPECRNELDFCDVFSLKPFGPLLHLKLDKLPFIQRLVTIHLDGREVNEDVFPRLPLDEPITF
jgi:hypothetical protein